MWLKAEKPGSRKNENEKRQLESGGRSETMRSRYRNPVTATERVKRQQPTQQQPFRRCGNDGKWKGKIGFCQGEWDFIFICLAAQFVLHIYISCQRWLAHH
jgi:hypothetical protein